VILYLDTSALIKLYVDEEHSQAVRSAVSEARAVSTHVIAYPETRATLARLRRENRLSAETLGLAKTAFSEDWARFARVQVSEVLLRRTGDLAESLALRGHDSVHLAAAEHVRLQCGTAVLFGCFDGRLNEAASLLGLDLLPR
jgi:predicted nucleic acid-binding protein